MSLIRKKNKQKDGQYWNGINNLYYEHIEFIKEQEQRVINMYMKYGFYSEFWAKRLIKKANFYLGMASISNICQRVSLKK